LTLLHVLISLIGIVTGLVVLADLIANRYRAGWTAWFLLFTVLTSVTGFVFFHDPQVTPAQILGVISLVVLAVALYALYGRGLAGIWRGVYAVTATIALYLNVFVLVVQTFAKVPPLRAIAPGNPPSGPVFMAVQGILLLAFIYLGWKARHDFKALNR
ncbi:MAG TPA: hypothetical protein VMU31_05400, partial [Rhizomicrobium sp.]|nr:hypothetical protein [Rhizomicrobium sp.]